MGGSSSGSAQPEPKGPFVRNLSAAEQAQYDVRKRKGGPKGVPGGSDDEASLGGGVMPAVMSWRKRALNAQGRGNIL